MHARVEIFLPNQPSGNLLANANVEFTGEIPIIIKGFRILNGKNGPWLAWPQRPSDQKDPQTGKTKYISTAWSEDKAFRNALQQLAVQTFYQSAQNGQANYNQGYNQNQYQQPQPPQQNWGQAPGYTQPQAPAAPAPVQYGQPPQQPQWGQPAPQAPPQAAPPQAPGYAQQPQQAPPAPPQAPQAQPVQQPNQGGNNNPLWQ